MSLPDFSSKANSQEIYEALVRTMSEGVVMHGPSGEILTTNPAAEKILGLSLAQMRGITPLDPHWSLILPNGNPATPDDIPSEITRRTGQPCRSILLGVRRGSGELAWLSVSSEPIPEINDGKKGMVVATFVDVTLQRTAEQRLESTIVELREALAEVGSANRAKTVFLANMSHELRTPLNAILGFSEIMNQGLFGVVANTKYRSYVADIYASALHLLGLINDILDLSRIEAGKLERVAVYLNLGIPSKCDS